MKQKRSDEPNSTSPRPDAASDLGRHDLGSIIASVEDQLRALKEAQSEHEQDLSAFEERRAELERRERSIGEERAALEKRAGELGEREHAVDERASELEQRAGELESQRAVIEEQREKARTATEEIEQQRGAMEQEAAALRSAREEIDTQRAALEKQQAELEHERDTLAARRESIDMDRQALDDDRAALESLQSELDEASKQLERERGEAKSELDRRAEELDRQAASLEEQRSRLEAGEDEASKKASQRIAGLESEASDLRARLEQSAKAVSERDEKIESLKTAIEERAQEERKKAQERVESTRVEGEQALEQAKASFDERFETAIREKDEEIAALQEQLERAAEERDEALTEAARAPAEGDSDEERLTIQIAKRDKAIEALSRRLEEAEQKRRELESSLQSGRSERRGGADAPAATGPDAEHLARRKQRLHRYKDLLRQQSYKLVQARKALGKRQSEYERVLKRREELAHAKAALDEASRKVLKSSARNRASVAALCLTIAVGLLGALSWAVSERVYPGEALLEATLAMRPEGGEATSEQYDAWKNYVTELTSDPRLMEIAAARMKRRGLLELAHPTDLTQHLDANLDMAALSPGELSLTLKGKGAKRTELALETLLASVVSVANDARQRRLDGATTTVTERPSAEDQPISEQRLIYAGAIWGGSTLLLLLLTGLVWFKASRAKNALEHDAVVERALDQERWMTAG